MKDALLSLANLATTKILFAVIAAILVVVAGKLVLRFVNRHIGKMKVEPTLHKFLMAACRVVIYFIAVMIVAGSLGFELSSLVALASVVSAAFALAASGVLSNLFGGILLLITRPFTVGDYVAIGGEEGIIQEVSILSTKLNTVDNKRITIPNSTIAGATIVNYSVEGKRRVDLVFSVGYDNDMERVKTAILATANNHELVIEKENTFVRVSAYNDSTISYTMRAWCRSDDYWTVYFDLLENVKKTFDQVGVTMAYPHLNVIMNQEEKA